MLLLKHEKENTLATERVKEYIMKLNTVREKKCEHLWAVLPSCYGWSREYLKLYCQKCLKIKEKYFLKGELE
jgi:hypothetical protein